MELILEMWIYMETHVSRWSKMEDKKMEIEVDRSTGEGKSR